MIDQIKNVLKELISAGFIQKSWWSFQAIQIKHRLRDSSPGRSLPAALITLAVGSILLTPFLAFVSSRSLGAVSAGETFNEQYAADAGIEFGIWSLLYSPAFRTQVDNNAGVPQALSFPGTLNGYTPTISVTGIPLGFWDTTPEDAPDGIDEGGSLAYAGGDRVYYLRGGKENDFGYYSISGDDWFPLAPTINNVDQGGSLTYGGGNFLFAFRGDNKDDFWRYNIGSNTWIAMDVAPDKVTRGGALVYDGGNYLYAFKGNKDEFWRYNITNDSWKDDLAAAPEKTGFGADLVYPGGNFIYAFEGNNKTGFWRYSISADSWTTLQDAPANVSDGGALAYHSGSYIYALRGNNSADFWRYTISTDTWTILTSSPFPVGAGGDLAFTHSEGGFAFQGGNMNGFWEFEVTPPRFDISSQAGDVTTNTRIELEGSSKEILFWDID